MSYHTCYKCSRTNPDYEWTTLCVDCRALINPPPAKTFLDRLTLLDLAFLERMKVKVESDMRAAVKNSKA